MHWFFSALIGAVVALITGVPLELYRRHRDRKSVAAVLCAEISSFARLAEKVPIAATYEKWAQELEAGHMLIIPEIHTPEPVYGPIFEKQIDKLGLLSADQSEKIVLYYNYLVGVRAAQKNLIKVKWEGIPDAHLRMARTIRSGLVYWSELERLSESLIPELRLVARETVARRFLSLWKGR